MLENLVKGVEKRQNGTRRITPYSSMKTGSGVGLGEVEGQSSSRKKWADS